MVKKSLANFVIFCLIKYIFVYSCICICTASTPLLFIVRLYIVRLYFFYIFTPQSFYSTTINSLFYRVKKLFFRVYGNSFFIVLKTKYSTTINSLFIDWVNSFFIVLQNSTFTIFTIKSQNISSYSIKRPLKFNFKAFFVYRHISLYLKLKNSNMGFLATNNTI